jgi:hypothetical protein
VVKALSERAEPWSTEERPDRQRLFGGWLCEYHHEVSIRIFAGSGVGRCFGCCPGKKVSMMRMRRLPQYGQGCSGALGSSGFVVAALMASIGMSRTASKARIRAMLLARVGLVSRP